MAGVHVFRTWEIGVAPNADAGVLICFDRGTGSQVAFLAAPKTAREIGRALIKQARKAEQAAAKATKGPTR